MRRVSAMLLLSCVLANPVAAQLNRPTPPPLVSAVEREWFQRREPIMFAGDLYYPAGPPVFFDGNEMVPTGSFDGVTLYAKTTIEPYSIVFVPIGGNLLQPHERRRTGELTGTVGSTMPSFPIRRDTDVLLGASPGAVAPATSQAPPRASAPVGVVSSVGTTPSGGAVGTTGVVSMPPRRVAIETGVRPEGNRGIWIEYAGARWRAAGPHVALVEGQFVQIGELRGRPVYVLGDEGNDRTLRRIYVPTATGTVAPFTRLPQ